MRGFRTAIGVLLALAFAFLIAGPAPAADAPTFNKDVAPVLFSHCAACHRPERPE